MKIGNTMKILTPLVVAMFILSLFSGAVVAQTAGETLEKEKIQYSNIKIKYDRTKAEFEKAKTDFESTANRFRLVKDNGADLENKTKDYLIRAIDHSISHLEIMKNRVDSAENKDVLPFDAVANINTHISQLETLKTKVQGATTLDELRTANRELIDLWVKIRLETRYYIGIVLNSKIDQFIKRGENVLEKIDIAIEKLKSQGKDVTKLLNERDEFKKLLDEAKESQAETIALFDSHIGFNADGMVTDNKAAEKFLLDAAKSQRETVTKFKEVARKVVDIFKEYKKLAGGKAVVGGTGTLAASGSGRAVIEGNVTVTLSAINGTMKVSGDANVTMDGTGTKEDLGNGEIKYQGFGSATIKTDQGEGNSVRVEITGNNIELTATGEGSAFLSGNGTYKTEKDFSVSGEWKAEV